MTPTRSAALVLIAVSAGACSDCASADGKSSSGGVDAAAADVVVAAEPHAALPCSGAAIDLAAVVGEPTCAITSALAKSTRVVFEIEADGGKQSLAQEAKRLDDGRVELRLVNRGAAPVALPLSWHPKIPAFIVLADNPKEKVIYELEAPPLGVELDGGPATARFARVTIAPGGYAFVRMAIDPKIIRRAGKNAADAGPLPAKLGEGKWMLHIGQLVTDVDTGAPATLGWLIEVTD